MIVSKGAYQGLVRGIGLKRGASGYTCSSLYEGGKRDRPSSIWRHANKVRHRAKG